MRRSALALLLLAGSLNAQTVGGLASSACPLSGCPPPASGPGSGTVTTTGTLASGQVALVSGATSITGDAGLTYDAGTDTLTVAGACVVPTLSPAADVLSQKRGTNAQTFRLYKTDDGAGNAEWIESGWAGAYGTHIISSTASGTGTVRGLGLQTTATLYLFASGVEVNAGVVYPGTANSYDIGLTSYPWRTGYFGTSLISPLLVSGPGKSGTNVAGTNNTIQAEPGTGSAAGSTLIFQTPTATTSGTTAQTQTTRLTVSEPAVIAAVPVRLAGYTVATLPAGTVGDTAYVTDATAPTYLGALTGGGAVTTPVFYNGAAWVSH